MRRLAAAVLCLAFAMLMGCDNIGGIFGGDPDPVAAPEVVGATADDPDDADDVLSSGDTLTIVFDMDTNMPAASAKAEIDALIDFSGKSLGNDYSGDNWGGGSTPDQLVITVNDATGNDLQIGDTIGIKSAGNLKNAAQTSPASTSSANVEGDWGIPAPSITSATAADPPPFAVGLSDGDTLTIVFDMNTNVPAASTKAEIDALIDFSGKSLGNDYSGDNWGGGSTPDQLVITVNDATGNDLQIGDTIGIKSAGNLKNGAGTSPSSTSSDVVGGSWD